MFDRPLTKRQLGWLILLGGVLLALSTFVVDLAGAGQFQGVGPAQLRVLGLSGLIVLAGLSLLPLGDRPA